MSRQEIFQQISKEMRASLERIRAAIPHSGEKGLEFENIVKEFLSKHLPKRFGVTPGFIIDKQDIVSSQQDIIIFDELNTPIYSVDDRNKVIPNDNVAIVIEVKATLSTEAITQSAEKIEKTKKLYKSYSPPPGQLFPNYRTLAFIFAFDSEISFEKIRETYVEVAKKRVSGGLNIDGIFVLDKGLVTLAVEFPINPRGQTPPDGPLFITGNALAIPGAKVNVASQEMGIDTLDYFMRLLLPQLATFYHNTDHPGFEWQASPGKSLLYEIPSKEPGVNDECFCTSGKKYKKCHKETSGFISSY
jgi:hypothetical protein